jgi:alkanesulfonate monooxygenase SsuD/methylene tetrahydromethanopterin reductase-like flavin-dependent oxidoreductase (luciferase family)
MAMEFGVFHEFHGAEGRTEAQAFRESFEEVEAAERWGLDAVWLAEIHFSPARSVLSAPMTVASAIAARTQRLKIGIAVQVLPLCHPLRIAEEAATVDQISQGRLIFGVGRSGFPRVYEAYGVPYAESRDRFAEALDIVKKAWTEQTFTYEGKYYSFRDICLVPKPYQKPHPPIRVAANSPDTFPAMGEQGYPIFAAVRLGTLSELAPHIQVYRKAYRAAGHPGAGQVFLRVPVYVADSYEQAIREPEHSIMHFYRYLGERLEDSAARPGARAIEQRAERGQRLRTITYEEARRDKIVVGTPEMVVDRLKQLQAELGLDGVLAELNCGSLIPHERVMHSLRLLCDKVMPAFR